MVGAWSNAGSKAGNSSRLSCGMSPLTETKKSFRVLAKSIWSNGWSFRSSVKVFAFVAQQLNPFFDQFSVT